jgi:hypothetical protein
MEKLTKLGKWLPVIWVVLAMVILVADYLTGPLVSLFILFVIPVGLAARVSGRRWGVGLGVLIPLAHVCFTFVWKPPWTEKDSVINAGVRMAVLVAVAVVIDLITRQAREIRALRGLLPVCCFCRKIRTEDQRWQQIEAYITEHSEAKFTHTFCPECAKKHYPEVFDKDEHNQGSAP